MSNADGQNRNYGDQSAPQQSYPPSNGVIAQARGGNPYAQQDQYPVQAQHSGDYQNGNPYAQQQAYGQQQGYAAGGAAVGGDDFWSELSSTNQLLGQLQEQIQAVRTAHQQSLVRPLFRCRSKC
jgi:syntaxin 1B/2/3